MQKNGGKSEEQEEQEEEEQEQDQDPIIIEEDICLFIISVVSLYNVCLYIISR